jgi:hypothetical protein
MITAQLTILRLIIIITGVITTTEIPSIAAVQGTTPTAMTEHMIKSATTLVRTIKTVLIVIIKLMTLIIVTEVPTTATTVIIITIVVHLIGQAAPRIVIIITIIIMATALHLTVLVVKDYIMIKQIPTTQ